MNLRKAGKICIVAGLILISLPSVGRDNSEFLSALNSFSRLNRISAINSCAFKIGDELANSPSLIDCSPPFLREGSCTRIERDDADQETNLVNMECRICGMQIQMAGKISRNIDENEDESKYNLSKYFFGRMRSNTSFDIIKNGCLEYVSSNSYMASDGISLADLAKVKDLDSLLSLQPELFEPLEQRFGGLLPSNGLQCTSVSDEDDEVANLLKSQQFQDVKRESNPLPLKFSQITRTEGGTSLLIRGLENFKILGAWEYQAQGTEKVKQAQKSEIEKRINHSLNGTIDIKLRADDLRTKTHHIIFDGAAPSASILMAALNTNVNPQKIKGKIYAGVLTRIVNPGCEVDDKENLNVSTKHADGTISTERYQLACRVVNYVKVLTISK